MKYTKEQRIDIGRQIYENEITRYQAAELYEINEQTARSYMRLYRDINNLPPKRSSRLSSNTTISVSVPANGDTLEVYESMTKNDLIKELIKSRINEARLKKGYEVKGDGSIVRYDSKNIK